MADNNRKNDTENGTESQRKASLRNYSESEPESMTDNRQKSIQDAVESHPSADEFTYTLAVGDRCSDNARYPRYGWALLSRWDPNMPVCDANPYPEEYIQEQTFDMSEYDEADDKDSKSPVSCDHILHPQRVCNTSGTITGWETDLSQLWDFIETIRDDYYEAGVESTHLPIRVFTARNPDNSYEIYFRDSTGEIEYIMWNSDEFGRTDDWVNSELIQKVLTAVGQAYEKPSEFIDKWEGHKYPL